MVYLSLHTAAPSCEYYMCSLISSPSLLSRFSGFSFFYAPNFEKVGDILVSACPCVCVCGGVGVGVCV